MRLHVDGDTAAGLAKSGYQRRVQFAVGSAGKVNVPGALRELKSRWLPEDTFQQTIGSVVAEKRPILTCGYTDCQPGRLIRIVLDRRTVNPQRLQAVCDPIPILFAQGAEYGYPDPKLRQSARGNRRAAACFAYKGARERLLTQLGQRLKTTEDFVDEQLTDYNHLGLHEHLLASNVKANR